MNWFQIHSLGFIRHRIYSFFKLVKSSIEVNIKLACQYLVKQFSVMHVCINLRVLLIELSLPYAWLFARFFSRPFPRISLISSLKFDRNWCSECRLIGGFLCYWSSHYHHTNLGTHWTSCTSNWFFFSRLGNEQHRFL